MSDERQQVVVVTNLTIERRGDGKMFAAHLGDLGLTAYGRTAENARASVTSLFNTWVNLHRQEGILEGRLDELRVEWFPFNKYEGNLQVEYTTPAPELSPETTRIAKEAPRYDASHDERAIAVAA